VVAVVAILSITINIVLAVFLGVLTAVALFVVRMSRSNIRRSYSCDKIHSRKTRTSEEAALLEKQGGDIRVLELQGVLFFGSAEMLSDEIERASVAGLRTVILDLRRVTEIDATGARILIDIQASLAVKNQRFGLSLAKNSETGARLLQGHTLEAIEAACIFEDIDRAMEWAEDDLIRIAADQVSTNHEISLTRVDLLSTLTSTELKAVESRMRCETFPCGQPIFHQGEPGNELFIVIKGRVSAYLNQSNGGNIRIATFAPGTVFGELAILDAGLRSATVVADNEVICYVLSDKQFAAIAKDAPGVAIKLLSGLGRELSRRLRLANQTIHQLEA
jgi:CRP-like cAMP-binding protein/anti-anti-sigma regulatory factor